MAELTTRAMGFVLYQLHNLNFFQRHFVKLTSDARKSDPLCADAVGPRVGRYESGERGRVFLQAARPR
jgi:hypothetical protein